MNGTKCFMTLRSLAAGNSALTFALSPFDQVRGRRWNGRGNVSTIRAPDVAPFLTLARLREREG